MDDGSGSQVSATPAQLARADMVAILDHARGIAEAAGRADLVQRLALAGERVSDPRLRVIVLGQLKQGKSRLINTIVNADVCRVGDDESTAVPTVVQYGATAAARMTLGSGDATRVVPVSMDEIHSVTPGSGHGAEDVIELEIDVPSPTLAEGVVLIDTPGVGGRTRRHTTSALAAVPGMDAVLWVTDASQEFTAPEMSFVRQVVGLCPAVACVVTKTDLYPHWRDIVAADREHMTKAEVNVPLLPVSSLMREHAVKAQDQELNAESGFPDLFAFLQHSLTNNEATTRRSVAFDVAAVVDHLRMGLTAELSALRDPNHGMDLVDRLTSARTMADQLRNKSARWQVTLNDGIADLVADIDHDLRDRLRRVTREAESAVDEGDPARNWDELCAWLEEQTETAVGDNFVWAHERAVWLAERVAEHFVEVDSPDLPSLHIAGVDGSVMPQSPLSGLDVGKVGLAQKVLVGMRGSYGGVLMIGLVTSLAGMALINPISIGAGIVLGTKAYREDRSHRVEQRRLNAKTAIRQYTDEVSFQVNKESKDRLRSVHRVLRDHFETIADQTIRSLGESVQAAQQAVATAVQERDSRIAEIERHLAELDRVAEAAAALEPR
jgi:hypothetical protein